MAKKKKATETDEGGGVAVEAQTSAEPSQMLALLDVIPSPENPRKDFEETAMASLKESLERDQQLQPILVKPANADGKYEILDGERRWRCFKDLGWLFIEAKVRSVDDEVDALFLRLIANAQRQDINPIEEARAYETLKGLGEDVPDIASRLKVSERHVYARIELLNLDTAIQEAVILGDITHSHAQLLTALDAQCQQEALYVCRDQGLSVRALGQWIQAQKPEECEGCKKPATTRDSEGVPLCGACHQAAEEDAEQDGADRTDGGADVVGEATEDLKRQEEAPARAEAAAAERKADETPDDKTTERREQTADEQFGERLMQRIAAAVLKKSKDHEELLLMHARRVWAAAPYGRKANAAPLLNGVGVTDVAVISLVDAARVLLALDLAELLASRSDWSRLMAIADDQGVDMELCKLEERAATLGISVKELQKQKRVGLPPYQAIRRNENTGELAPPTRGKSPAEWVRGYVDSEGFFFEGDIPKKKRADKGKTRKSEKVSGKAIKAAVAAAKKGKEPKGKKAKKK